MARGAGPRRRPVWGFLGVFLLYPLARIFYDAVSDDAGRLTLGHFHAFFTDGFYLRSLGNSLLLGVGVVAASSVLGIGIAFLLVRYEFWGRRVFSYLTLIPIISPPLVGVLGFVFILGRAGTVNVLLMDYLGPRPARELHVRAPRRPPRGDAPPLPDDHAERGGRPGQGRPRPRGGGGERGRARLAEALDGHLPLTTPGYVAGALLVFIWTFADFVTPLVVGVHDLLASQAYLNIVQFVDRRLFRMGIVISALLVLLAVVFLLLARHYVAIKDYSSLAYTKVERRRLPPLLRRWSSRRCRASCCWPSCPTSGIALAAFGRGWSLTPFPTHYTLQFFERVLVETPKYVANSLLYAGLAVVLCVVVGLPIAWILARTRLPGRGALDALNTLILAIPGTAIGIAYVRAFHGDLPGSGCP